MGEKLNLTKIRYSEYIMAVPWPYVLFVISRVYCEYFIQKDYMPWVGDKHYPLFIEAMNIIRTVKILAEVWLICLSSAYKQERDNKEIS